MRLRLELDLVKLEQVEAWADVLIAQIEAPRYELTDIALARAKGKDVAIAALATLGGNANAAEDVVLALASAEVEGLSYEQLHKLIDAVSLLASLSQIENTLDVFASADVLGRVHEFNCFWPEPDGEAGRQMVANAALKYLRLVRETAAGVRRPVV